LSPWFFRMVKKLAVRVLPDSISWSVRTDALLLSILELLRKKMARNKRVTKALAASGYQRNRRRKSKQGYLQHCSVM
jgi:hypothetical protein